MRKLFIISISLTCFSTLVLFGQDTRYADSLRNVWNNNELHDTSRLSALDDLGWYFQTLKNDSAIYYADKQINYANKKGLKSWKAKGLMTKGLQLIESNDFNKKNLALDLFNESLKIRNEIKDTLGVGACLGNIGVFYVSVYKDYKTAIKYYLEGLDLYEKIGDVKGQAICKFNVASIYTEANEYQSSLKYSNEMVKIGKELNDDYLILIGTSYLALNYYHLKRYDEAMVYANIGIDKSKSIGSSEFLDDFLGIKTNISIELNELDEALKSVDKRIDYANASEVVDSNKISNSYGQYGAIYFKLKDYKNSIEYYSKAIEYSKNKEISELLIFYKGLSDANRKIGNYELALKYYEKSNQLKDSIDNQNNINDVRRIEFKYNYDKKITADSVKMAERQKVFDATMDKEKTKKYTLYGGIVVAMLLAGFIFNRLKASQKQKAIIEEQKNIVEEKQNQITDSINYAKRIQMLLLANNETLAKSQQLKEHFVLYLPKDIVSGDFYWAAMVKDRFYLAVCDSTGHGVPGAFMSLLNTSFLNEAIIEKQIKEPHEVLNYIRRRLIENLGEGKDGMDATLVCFEKHQTTYASAHNKPLLVKQNGELIELPADKMPVGNGERDDSFQLSYITVEKGDMLYFFTDGFSDQFGGKEGKKFKSSKLKKTLLSIHSENVENQKIILNKTFEDWKGNLEQVDDVCMIGIRI